MGRYGGALACHGKPFFVDRFIQVLEKMAYPHVDAFARHGEMLFNHIEHLPSGFCHGDFHTGNMLLDASGRYSVLDYDAAAWAFPAYDMATICDMTDYFSLSEKKLKDGFAQTGKMVDRFLKGYCPYRGMSDEEISSVYSFIALRHFDIQATIIESIGPTCVSEEFIDDQLAWLMKWDLLVK
jgi:Ser/Thr protein kinase RdoA (MazF antagonist)